MSTVTLPDLATPAVPLRRSWLVELRKLIDTRTGAVLTAVGALLTGVFGGGAALGKHSSFGSIAQMAGVPAAMMVSILAILLVTAERSHHTALSTFVLQPRRTRVMIAKAGAAVMLALAAGVLSLLAALIITPVGAMVTGTQIPWSIAWAQFGLSLTVSVITALSGVALGMAIGNAPGAIVLMLSWPMIESMIIKMLPAAEPVFGWLDVAAVRNLGDGIQGFEAAQVVTSVAAWVALPGLIGLVRVCREEVR